MENEWKTKPLTEQEKETYYLQGFEAGSKIGRMATKKDFLSHIDAVVKLYPAFTVSMIKALKEI